MSNGARLTLAIALAIATVGFFLTGLLLGEGLPRGATPFYILALVSLAGSLACLVPRTRPLTLRIVGGSILAAYSAYVYSSLGGANLARALTGFVVFGLPSAYLLIWGTWPRWGYMSPAFAPQFGDDANADGAEIVDEGSREDRLQS